MQLQQTIAADVDCRRAVRVRRDDAEPIEDRHADAGARRRNITDYAYRRGEATLIEFLDAQRAFNDTMQAWNEARGEYARRRISGTGGRRRGREFR